MTHSSTPNSSTQSIPPLVKGRWTRVYDGIINDPVLQRMPNREFARKYRAALLGEEVNEFTKYMRPGYERLPANQWIPLRRQIFERDNYTCQYCGEHGGKLECDHVIPVSRGGSHEPDNLVTACFRCNRSKRDKLVEEWR